jgi:glycosyltransferase involved in cell wall biosynthesis
MVSNVKLLGEVNMKKKKILIFIDWFIPAYKAGGPIQSVSNMVTHLKSEFDFWIYTSNSDLNEPLSLPSKSLNKWIKKDDFNIMYVDASQQNVKFLKKLLHGNCFDAVYINSLFSLKFSIQPLIVAKQLNSKVILAPRGMLGAGALSIKPLKKKLFLKVFKIFGGHKNIIWHATDVSEKVEIVSHFGNETNVMVAPNLTKKVIGIRPNKNKQVDSLRLFFLSRIAVKKNLLTAIKALSFLQKDVNIEFSIIGPIEETEYWKQCQSEFKSLPNNVKVSYLGATPNHELSSILNNQHVMILPTQHENFGHVIMESWQAGCPVIISKNTPWKDLESKHLGFDLHNNNFESYVEAIHHFAKMNQLEFDKWSKASYDFGKAFSENKVIINKTKQIFS